MPRNAAPKADLDSVERLRRHVRILVDLGRLAGENLELDKFLDQVVVQVARAVEIDHVKVLLYRRARSDFIVAAGYGWKEGVVRQATLPADIRSPAGRAFQTGEPVTISDWGSEPGFTAPAMLKEHGIVALANVPLFIDGATSGVLEVDSTVPCDFNPDTTEFLMAVSTLIGGIMQRLTAEQNENEARAAKAAVEARYQDLLLREMQHRVKNNFQFILSSVALQKRRFKGAEIHRALSHIENRISAISLAHDHLAPRRGHATNLAGYVRALCASLEQQAEGVAIELNLDEVELAIDRAVAVGLVLNETVTNSIKHAFGDGGGRISVSLKGGVGYGEARLTIADNGHGIKPDSQPGSGLGLISLLARQIGSTVERQSSDQGTTLSLTFPLV